MPLRTLTVSLTDAPIATEAAVLLHDLPRLDFDDLCTRLNAAMDLRSDLQLAVGGARGKGFALLTNPNFHVLISANGFRYKRAQMAAALATPIARMKVFDYGRAARQHRRHIFVTVGSGPLHMDGGMAEAFSQAGVDTAAPVMPLGFRASVLRHVLMLLEPLAPLAIHWRQSNMMFDPSEIALAGNTDLPAAQIVHPLPLRARDDSQSSGIIAACSEQVIGRTLQVDPGQRDMAQSVNMALSMMIEKASGRLPLAHGDVLELSSGAQMYIRHEAPNAQWPAGRICLGETAPSGPAPMPEAMPEPAPAAPDLPEAPAPAEPDATYRNAEFADRLARLKAKATPPATTEPQAPPPDDLRDMARDAIDASERGRRDVSPMLKLALAVICLGYGAMLLGGEWLGGSLRDIATVAAPDLPPN